MGTALLLLGLLVGEGDWKAGFGSADITPKEPVRLSGYASRNRPFEKVLSPIFAKAMALEDGKGTRALMVTADLIGFRSSVADPLCARLVEKLGIPRDRILLNASHTHTGPVPSLSGNPYGNAGAEEAGKTVEYTKWMMDRIVEAAEGAVADLSPATLSHGWGVVDIPMNRREFTDRGVRLGVNPKGLVDRSVPVLRVDGPDGTMRGVLFGCACHGTTLTGKHYVVSGDYMGVAQARIQKAHPGATALFMAGCGGDANPYPRGEIEHVDRHGRVLADEVSRVLGTKLAKVEGPLSIAFGRADLPFQEAPSREELERLVKSGPGYQRGVFRAQLVLLEKGEKPATHYPAPVSVWQFGDDLTLVGLSGEVVVDYVSMTERALGPMRLWVAGYCNDVMGYVVTARVLAEGGYETRGTYHGAAGLLAPEAQDVLIRKVVELARRAGRPFPGPGDVRRH